MKYIERYKDFLDKCKGKIPEIQFVQELELNPKIDLPISPPPRKWFVESFDWIIGMRLLCGGDYGPFYRIDGDIFWPMIGNQSDEYSENKCFFGLEKPKDTAHAERLYKFQSTTETKYIYEISIQMPDFPIMDAWVFIGPVKDAEGFQLNPNSIVAEIIKGDILKSKVKRYSVRKKGIIDYSKSEAYYKTKKK
jgi:hypothetical protein